MHSTRTASIRPLIPTVTPTAMVSPTVPPGFPSTSQGLVPPTNRNVNSATVALAPEPRIHEVQPGPSRGQASVFKGPRVIISAQAQEGSAVSEVQATVSPIIAASNTDEPPERSYDENVEPIEEQRSSDELQTVHALDITEGISEDYSATSSLPIETEYHEGSEEA